MIAVNLIVGLVVVPIVDLSVAIVRVT